jgi:hypothetical protein
LAESRDFAWVGEKNRELNVYRVCRCGVCSSSRAGVGYLSFSDSDGNGFTIWIKEEEVFRRLRRAINSVKVTSPDSVTPRRSGTGHLSHSSA